MITAVASAAGISFALTRKRRDRRLVDRRLILTEYQLQIAEVDAYLKRLGYHQE